MSIDKTEVVMGEASNKLLGIFRQFTAKSTGLLVMEILVKWGYERVSIGIISDERGPAYQFWYKLKEMSSDFSFDTLVSQFTEGNLQLSDQEVAQKSNLLLAELRNLPYEEAITELVTASYLWLSSCGLEQYKIKEETEQEIKQRFCSDWAIALGVI